jgi:hypothetical protein
LTIRESERRKFLKGAIVGAGAVAIATGFDILRIPKATSQPPSDPSDPTFDSNGVQLPSLTSNPAHRQGSIYFRSDISQLMLDDGTSYWQIEKQQIFSKGGTILSPVEQTIVVWRAQFPCTVTAVKGYQDAGTGSVVTAFDGTNNLLNTDITIGTAATWVDGGSIAYSAVSAGDSIYIAIVSVAGTPNYIGIQVEFTMP